MTTPNKDSLGIRPFQPLNRCTLPILNQENHFPWHPFALKWPWAVGGMLKSKQITQCIPQHSTKKPEARAVQQQASYTPCTSPCGSVYSHFNAFSSVIEVAAAFFASVFWRPREKPDIKQAFPSLRDFIIWPFYSITQVFLLLSIENIPLSKTSAQKKKTA